MSAFFITLRGKKFNTIRGVKCYCEQYKELHKRVVIIYYLKTN